MGSAVGFNEDIPAAWKLIVSVPMIQGIGVLDVAMFMSIMHIHLGFHLLLSCNTRLLLLRVGIWRVYFLLEMNDQSKAPPPRLYQDRRVTTRMSHLLTVGWLHLQAVQDSKTWFFVLKLRV